MKDIGLVFLGAFIAFITTALYRFFDNYKKEYNEKIKLINDLCYNLLITKKMITVSLNKWVEYHNYHRAQKDSEEKIIEDLMLLNKADYEKSVMSIFELDVTFERLCSEFSFIFPKESWFIEESEKVKNFDLTISYDDYENVNSKEELKIAHQKYTQLINHRIDYEFDPVIDNFIVKLRDYQNDLKKNLNFIIKHWA